MYAIFTVFFCAVKYTVFLCECTSYLPICTLPTVCILPPPTYPISQPTVHILSTYTTYLHPYLLYVPIPPYLHILHPYLLMISIYLPFLPTVPTARTLPILSTYPTLPIPHTYLRYLATYLLMLYILPTSIPTYHTLPYLPYVRIYATSPYLFIYHKHSTPTYLPTLPNHPKNYT